METLLNIIKFSLKTRKEIGFNDFVTSDLFLSKVKGQMMGQIDAGPMPDYNTMMGFKKLPT